MDLAHVYKEKDLVKSRNTSLPCDNNREKSMFSELEETFFQLKFASRN